MNKNIMNQVPISKEREDLKMRKPFMKVHEYRNADVTLDRKEGKSEEYIKKKTTQWHEDDRIANLSTFEQRQLYDKKNGRSDGLTTRIFNFGFSSTRWDYQFEDRYGVLRLGLWATVILISGGTSIYKYRHRKVTETKNSKKKND